MNVANWQDRAEAVTAPAVPEYCKDCGKHWTDATAHANLCVAEMLRQDTKQSPAMAAVPAERLSLQPVPSGL